MLRYHVSTKIRHKYIEKLVVSASSVIVGYSFFFSRYCICTYIGYVLPAYLHVPWHVSESILYAKFTVVWLKKVLAFVKRTQPQGLRALNVKQTFRGSNINIQALRCLSNGSLQLGNFQRDVTHMWLGAKRSYMYVALVKTWAGRWYFYIQKRYFVLIFRSYIKKTG